MCKEILRDYIFLYQLEHIYVIVFFIVCILEFSLYSSEKCQTSFVFIVFNRCSLNLLLSGNFFPILNLFTLIYFKH